MEETKKLNKNNALLEILTEIKDLNQLQDKELIETAQKIANTINLNGLKRNTINIITELSQPTTECENEKLAQIHDLLFNQAIIIKNVKGFKRKTPPSTTADDLKAFITITTNTLETIIPTNAETKKNSTSAVKEDKTMTAKTTATSNQKNKERGF